MNRPFPASAAALAAAVCAACAILTPVAAQAAWRRAESAHFVVYSDVNEHELRAYVDKLEDFDHIVRSLDGSAGQDPKAAKFQVYFVRSEYELDTIYPGAVTETAGIFAYNSQDIFFVDSRRSLMDRYADVTTANWLPKDELINRLINYNIRYHYTNKVIFETYGTNAPSWFLAGAARFFATTQVESGYFSIGGEDRSQSHDVIAMKDWVPLQDVLTKQPFYMTAKKYDAFRYESWLLVHYMASDAQRRQKLGKYILAVEAGADPIAAWSDIVGGSVDDLKAKLNAYVFSSAFGVSVHRSGQPHADIALTTLPPSADDLLLRRQQLKLGVAEGGEKPVLDEIRSLAAKYPNERFVQLILAHAEVTLGDQIKGEDILHSLLQANPNDVEAQLTLALGRIAEGDASPNRQLFYDEAAEILAPTLKLAPDNVAVLYTRAKGLSFDPDYPREETLAGLRHALELAPLAFDARKRLAEALLKRGDFDAAVKTMIPMVSFRPGEALAQTIDTLQKIESARADKAETPKS